MSKRVDRQPTRAIVSKDQAPWCDCGGTVLLIHEKDYGKIGIVRGRCASCNTRVSAKFAADPSARQKKH